MRGRLPRCWRPAKTARESAANARSKERDRARDARRPQAMILAFALCATAAAFVGPSTPQKTTALQHHKVRSQVADLKIYREEIDWETGEVVKREVEETVDDLVAKQPVKLKYTYEERRGEEGQKLALPPVFGGVGAAIAVAAIAAQEPVAALFATPAVLGAAAFAVNELKPVPVTYVGNCVEINQCVACTR